MISGGILAFSTLLDSLYYGQLTLVPLRLGRSLFKSFLLIASFRSQGECGQLKASQTMNINALHFILLDHGTKSDQGTFYVSICSQMAVRFMEATHGIGISPREWQLPKFR